MGRRSAGASPAPTGTRRRKRRRPALPSSVFASVRLPLPPGSALPASEFLNQRVWLEDIWGAKARRMADGLDRPREPEALMTALEAAVARHSPPADARRSEMGAAFELAFGRRTARKIAGSLAGRTSLLERAHIAPALRGGLRLWTEDARSHPAVSAVSDAGARLRRCFRRQPRRRDRLCRPGPSGARKPPSGASTPRDIANLFA